MNAWLIAFVGVFVMVYTYIVNHGNALPAKARVVVFLFLFLPSICAFMAGLYYAY